MVSDDTCDNCASHKEEYIVQKLRIDIFCEGRAPLE